MDVSLEAKEKRFLAVLIVLAIALSLFAGGLLGYSVSFVTISGKIDELQTRVATVSQNAIYSFGGNVTYFLSENVSLSQLYRQVKDSVVIVQGLLVQYDIFRRPYYTQVLGSGFVCNFTGKEIVITNYHVVQNAINITMTFTNGNAYAARVLGSDPYEDLAILLADVSPGEWRPLEIASSSSLEGGDSVIAVGNPYGLTGSMTIGIVSALGRTITEEMTGRYPIASIIQTSTAINPGNSGGPLLNYQGQVIGITTAIVSDSQGLGFAVPSNTILREIESLVTKGSYDQHPWLGATGTDMTFEIAKAMGTNVTCGWLVSSAPSETTLRGGTSQVRFVGSTVTIGGDIIIAIDGTRVRNLDDLSTYLEEHTLPNQTIELTLVRNDETMSLLVKLQKRASIGAA